MSSAKFRSCSALSKQSIRSSMWKAVFLFGFLLVACCATPFSGGYVPVDVDDEGVVAAANYTSEEMSRKFFSPYHHRLVKVLKAKESRDFSGVSYQLDVILGMTNCKKADVKYEELADCDFQEGVSTYKKCIANVYRDLKDNHKLVSTGCTLADKKDL